LGFSKNWASGPSWDYFLTYRKVWNLRKMISALGNRGINIALKSSNCLASEKEVCRLDLVTSWLQLKKTPGGLVKNKKGSKFLVVLRKKFKKISRRLLAREAFRMRKKARRKSYYFNTIPKMFAPCHIADIVVRFSAKGLNVRVFFVSMLSRKKVWHRYTRTRGRKRLSKRRQRVRALCRLRYAKKQLLLLLRVRNALERAILREFTLPCEIHLHNFFYYRQGAKALAVSQRTLPDNARARKKKKALRKKHTITTHAALALAQAFFIGNPWLVAQLIAFRFEKTQKHYQVLQKIFLWLRHLKVLSYNIIGIQVLICGKLGANTQTQFKYLTLGRSIYTQTLAARLRYGYAEAETFTGTFGVHVWFLQGKLLRIKS
jgi:hypothetical protein